MHQGGAARVASILANLLSEKDYEVILASDYSAYPLKYNISEIVRLEQLDYYCVESPISDFLTRLKSIRRIYHAIHPDVVIAFMDRMYRDVKLSLWCKRVPIIVSDHTSMDIDSGFMINFIRHYFYATASVATILTEKDSRYLGKKIPNKVAFSNAFLV